MDIKKSLKDVIVLFVICAVFATVLAAVNSVTAPIIADRLAGAANEAYMAVMPDAKGFEDVDLSKFELPATVKEAKKETSGLGYAIKLEATGYKPGMVIIVGISADGVITGATCIASSETWGLETSLGDKMVGKDVNTVVDVEAGATSLTVNGYRAAVKDALNAVIIFGGGSADFRTEEEILADNLNDALGLKDITFTKMFMVEVVEGVDKIYTADNGAGYVCVIGEEFIGVGTDGVALGDSANKDVAEAAVAIVAATELTDVDLTAFEGISARITAIKVTATGNYVIDIEAEGHGKKGDEHSYPSGKYTELRISISAEGKVIDCTAISSGETETWGGAQLKDGAYNSNFIGKDQTEANAVDTVANSTNTTKGYKQAVLRAFEAYTIIVGGATNE